MHKDLSLICLVCKIKCKTCPFRKLALESSWLFCLLHVKFIVQVYADYNPGVAAQVFPQPVKFHLYSFRAFLFWINFGGPYSLISGQHIHHKAIV